MAARRRVTPPSPSQQNQRRSRLAPQPSAKQERVRRCRVAETRFPATLRKLWTRAAAIDPTLRVRTTDWSRLITRRVFSLPYDRDRLFEHLMTGRVGLFRDAPIQLKGHGSRPDREAVVSAISKGFRPAARARVQLGPKGRRSVVSVAQLLELWQAERRIVSTTDLHLRGTELYTALEAKVLSDFNVLCANPKDVLSLEMMTLVISSAGNLTDSHSDDADGSNHCFVGRKLWLAWDRREGRSVGLEDCTHDEVFRQASFSIRRFLALPSARWWIVSPGQTLFLPGNLTHKVVTLESYIGFGSFLVTLPSYFRALSRWVLEHTLDVNRTMLDRIGEATNRTVRRVRRSPSPVRSRWGVGYLGRAYSHWKDRDFHGREQERQTVMAHPAFRSFVAAAELPDCGALH